MCTVIYIPKEDDGFLFATSRDEHEDRPTAEPPAWHQTENGPLFYPKDPVGGGSWIAVNNQYTLCILNGAFEPHKHQPPYRQSRGLIPLHFLAYTGVQDFLENYRFEGLEPFTFLIIDDKNLHEIRWDQNQKVHHRKFDPTKSHLWASAPLYNREMVEMREKWFAEFLNNHQSISGSDILNFYLKGGNGDPHTGLMINRENGVKTVSISCVEKTNKNTQFHYRTGGNTRRTVL